MCKSWEIMDNTYNYNWLIEPFVVHKKNVFDVKFNQNKSKYLLLYFLFLVYTFLLILSYMKIFIIILQNCIDNSCSKSNRYHAAKKNIKNIFQSLFKFLIFRIKGYLVLHNTQILYRFKIKECFFYVFNKIKYL